MDKNELEIIKEGKTGHGILIENDGYISLDSTNRNRQIKEDIDNANEWFVPKPFVVDCILQKFDTKNANGRIYPEHVLKREVAKYQKMVDERMALGELNHPMESTIDLGRISHNIVEMHWEGKTLVGKIELNVTEGFRKYGIVTTCGDHAAQLLLSGFRIGVSSRGVGSVEQKLGQYIVGDDFELVSVDIVSSPSTPGAYIGNTEYLQQFVENDTSNQSKSPISEKINRIKNILNS